MQLYRQISFGHLAEFFVLDARQYRTDQPCGDGNKPLCDAAFSPEATITGVEQERWLTRELAPRLRFLGAIRSGCGMETGGGVGLTSGYQAAAQRAFLGSANALFPNLPAGGNYFVTVEQRASVATPDAPTGPGRGRRPRRP